MDTAVEVASVTFPARSRTRAVAVRPRPSPAMIASAGAAPSRPDSASAADHLAVTLPRYQPAALGDEVTLPDSVGAVVSMLTSLTRTGVVFPAASATVPTAYWPAPSAVKVRGAGHVAMPETASAHSHVAVTGPLFQPLTFAAGSRVVDAVGAEPSMRTVNVRGASELP